MRCVAPALPIGTVEVGVSLNGLDLVGGSVMVSWIQHHPHSTCHTQVARTNLTTPPSHAAQYTVTKQNPSTLDSAAATAASRTYQGPVMAHPNMFNIAPVEPAIEQGIEPAADISAITSASMHTSTNPSPSPSAEPNSLAVFSIVPRAAAASMATDSVASGGASARMITVTGANFVSSNKLTCRFTATKPNFGHTASGGSDGHTYVTGHWTSPTTLKCAAPDHPPGVVAFAVSNNGVDFVESVERFTFEPAMTISTLYPLSGSILGGTVLRVKGTNFPTDRPLSCWFDRGQMVVPATVIDRRTAECHVPRARTAGRVVVQVCEGGSSGEYGGAEGGLVGAGGGWGSASGRKSMNRCSGGDDVDHIQSAADEAEGRSIVFEYLSSPPRVTSVTPTLGSTTGGTKVTVTGTGFIEGSVCTFDGVRATTSTATSMSTAASMSMSATADVRTVGAEHDTLVCDTPAHVSEVVVVAVAVGGDDGGGDELRLYEPTAHDAVTFKYHPPPTIVSVTPDRVSELGGATVRLSGIDLINTPGLSCMVDGVVAQGRKVHRRSTYFTCYQHHRLRTT